MRAFIARRIALALITLLAVLTIIFMIVRILPGDPALVILGDQADAQAVAALRARLGLDQPLLHQYASFLTGALLGDWGTSLVTGRPVMTEVSSVLPWTIELTVVALAFGALIGIPLGVWAAIHRNRWIDYVTRVGSLVGLSFPAFVSGIALLILLAIHLQWFPVISARRGTAWEWFSSLALPAFNLGLIMAAYITRVTRSAMLEVLSEDYVRTARAKGAPWSVVVWRHALRNALMPIITIVGLYLGVLIGNSVLTEIVFNRPGLGKLIVGALNQRDYTLLQGMMVVYTLLVVGINLLTDLVYGLVDPRVKMS